MRSMKDVAVLSAILVCSACAAPPQYVLRYDLDQLALETSIRDASPGFENLPTTAPDKTGTPGG